MPAARIFLVTLLASVAAKAAVADESQASRADCLSKVASAYDAAVGSPPSTVLSGGAETPAGAACFLSPSPGGMWVTVTSRIHSSGLESDFESRLAAISQLRTVRYWSTTDHQWRRMFSTATALEAEGGGQPRDDFSLEEFRTGGQLHYSLTDSRSSHPVLYELRRWPELAPRLIVETTNVDPITDWGVTVFASGGLHTLYFLEERSPHLWVYYSITRIVPASLLAQGHPRSYINRAVAMYRYIIGLPTDAEPPAAP